MLDCAPLPRAQLFSPPRALSSHGSSFSTHPCPGCLKNLSVLPGHKLGKDSAPSFWRCIFFSLTLVAEIVTGIEMKEIIFTLQSEQT